MYPHLELLTLIALPSEAQEILRRHPRLQRDTSLGQFPLYRCERTHRAVAVMGSGIARGAGVLSFLAARFSIHRYINIGLAGALADDLALGEAYHCRRVLQHDSYLLRSESRSFLRPGTICFSDLDAGALPYLEPLYPRCFDLPERTLLCGSAFIADEASKRKLGAWGELVDMESSGIVQAAALWGIPGDIVKVVSDTLKGDGQADFVKNEYLLTTRIAELYDIGSHR